MMSRCAYFLLGWMVWVVVLLVTLGLPFAMANCDAPPEIDGASHNLTGSPPHLINTQIRYQCGIGYDELGLSRMYHCNGTHWVGEGYACDEILCRFIDPPANGEITNNPTYTIGSRIEFGCLPGYRLVGPSYRRCRLDGWTSRTPVCQVKMCGEFGGVEHADLFQEALDGVVNDYGSEITVTCQQNYILSGPARVTCGADGQWSAAPTCEPSVCPEYPASTSRCTDLSILDDDLYIITCVSETENTSALRVGASFAICLNNQWSDTDMACYCNCKVRVDPEKVELHNVDSNNFLSHEETLQWSCRKGRKISEIDFVCYDGNMEQPDCIVPTTTSSTTVTTTTTSTTTTTLTIMTTPTTTTTQSPIIMTTPTTTKMQSPIIMTTPMTTTTQSSTKMTTPASASTTTTMTTTTSSIISVTPAKTLPTQTPLDLSENSTSVHINQIYTEISACNCKCSIQLAREHLNDFHIDTIDRSNCSIHSDARASSYLYCDFYRYGNAICQQSGRNYNTGNQPTAFWRNVTKALKMKTQIKKVCKCMEASRSPLNNAGTRHNMYIRLYLLIFIAIR